MFSIKPSNITSSTWAAFTIIELMVVLLLSSVVFSMALLVLDIFNQQLVQQATEHKAILDLQRFKSQLQQDVELSQTTKLEEQQIVLEGAGSTIVYQFEDQQISREVQLESAISDTFALVTKNLTAQWQRQAVSWGLVDQLTWEGRFLEQPFSLKIYKTYTAQTLFQLQEQATTY